MSNSILYRQSLIRASGDGRTVYGVAVPFNQVTDIDEGYGRPYREKFAVGAFARSIRERGDKVRLFVGHDSRRLPIGRAVELREAADGLHTAFSVSSTRDGDEALQLVRDGVVDAFSIGFRPIRDRQEDGVTVRVEAALMEISLVGLPAYPGATVSGVRSVRPVLSADIARRRLTLILETW